MKRAFSVLAFCLVAVALYAQQTVTEEDFTESFSYLISLLTAGITFLVKSKIIKKDTDTVLEQLLKNGWVLSAIAFGAVAFVFVQFGFTSANLTLGIKFIIANFLGVIIGLVQKNTPTTPPTIK